MDIEITEPYTVFKGLSITEMEQLHDDIKMYLYLDRTHIQYWEALLALRDWEFIFIWTGPTSRRKAQLCGLLLQGKTYGELARFQTYIESEMRSGTAKVVEYWEAVLKCLHICKAKACLKEFHSQLSHKQLVHLEKPSNDKDTNHQEFDLDAQEQDDIHEGKGVQDLSPEPIEAAG